jgi:DNA-binding transcriptional LysR family regulator
MVERQIQYFIQIVQHDVSFTKAAIALNISQPALSKHISVLENKLGLSVFDTSKKTAIKLTPAGKMLFEYFKQRNEKFNLILDEARKLNNQFAGTIKIAVLSGWDISTLLQKLDGFNTKYPHIELQFDSVDYKDIEYGVMNNLYDITFTMSNQFKNAQNVQVKNFCESKLLVLFSKNNPLAKKTNLSVTDFEKEPLYVNLPNIMPKKVNYPEEVCLARGFTPKIKCVSHYASMLLAIESGSGFTICDQLVREKNNAAFKYFELDETIAVCAVWKKTNKKPGLLLFINEYLQQV